MRELTSLSSNFVSPFLRNLSTSKQVVLDRNDQTGLAEEMSLVTLLNSGVIASIYTHRWCHGVVVKHADWQHKGCPFNSSIGHKKNAIDEEGNGIPPQ